MKKFLVSLVILMSFVSLGAAQPAWQELKGDHFIVYYTGEEAYARELLRKAERYYDQIASDLGYARYSNFWQWDKRVKVRVYPKKNDFLEATGQPSWSIGNANYTTKEISSFAGCVEFLDGTLPHEIAHLIFRDFVGFEGEVPLWLDEGVAQRQEPFKRQAVAAYAKLFYAEKKLLPFSVLMRSDTLARASDEEAKVFYVQSASVVGFLIDRYGADDFAQFCRQLRDGKGLNDSLRFSYSSRIRSVDELEKAWRAYVGGL